MPLRVVIADEHAEALCAACRLVEETGDEVVGTSTAPSEAPHLAAAHRADLAVVAVHADHERALLHVQRLATEADCPVVLLLDGDEPELVREALRRGLDAYADRATPGSLRSAFALAYRRFAERQEQAPADADPGAHARATIDQAKGILMERHGLAEPAAYQRLRREARRSRVPIAEVAAAVVQARPLLHGDDGAAGPGPA